MERGVHVGWSFCFMPLADYLFRCSIAGNGVRVFDNQQDGCGEMYLCSFREGESSFKK